MIDLSGRTSIFKDPEYTRQFHDCGYVIVPFLNEDEIKELMQLYKEFYPYGVKGFFSTTFANNVDHREKVNVAIREICAAHIEDIFVDYKILFSSFIVKAPDERSELIVHQDMTLLDERNYSGINIWCPLVDLTPMNGAIELLPRSHRFFETYRGSSIPDIYDNVVDEIKSIMEPCMLRAGEAIIFDQSIIHYSPPNRSTAERPVINTFVAHKDAQIKICYWDKKNGGRDVEIFEQSDDFFEQFENFGHNIFNRPTIGKLLGNFPYEFPKLTREMLEAEYGIRFPEPKINSEAQLNKSWFKRIFTS